MSDSPASEPPGEGAPPPLVPSLPQPHLPRPGEAVATYGPQGSAVDTGKEKAKAGGWSPGSRPPLREKRGCGCGAVLAALVLILGLAIMAGFVGLGYLGPGRFVKMGYEVVELPDGQGRITEAPTVPTFYYSRGPLYWEVPLTRVPVALCAREIHVEGDFFEPVFLIGLKVQATERARFAKDLEVIAAEFTDPGITLKGRRTGLTLTELP